MERWLRRVGIALLCSLFAGFAFGTCLRQRAERPTLYLGALGGSLRVPALPLDVGDAGAAVLDPREHEEQVREAVQVAQRDR
jgi:hypothetical protein